MRLRRGKSRPRGSQPIGISDSVAPIFGDARDHRDRFGRIGLAVTAGEDADRAGFERGGMRAQIDPAREPGDDDIAGLPRPRASRVGESEARRRSVAGTHERERRLLQRLVAAEQAEERRRRVDRTEARADIRARRRR